MKFRIPFLALALLLTAVPIGRAASEPPPLLPPKPKDPLFNPPEQAEKKPVLYFYQLPLVSLPQTTGISLPLLPLNSPVYDAVQKAGFRWGRMDLPWSEAEKQKGVYDFSAYAAMAAELKKRKIEPIFTLGLTNPLYEEGKPPRSAEGRAAVAAFAGAAATQLKGRAKAWEMGGAPNSKAVWGAEPDPADYAALAVPAAKAIRAVDSKAVILSGGAQGSDLNFLRRSLASGLNGVVSGVAVRPLSSLSPEAWGGELGKLKQAVKEYGSGQGLSIWVTGWTVPEDAKSASPAPQAAVRRLLYDYGQNLPATILSLEEGVSSSADLAQSPAFKAAEFMNRHLDGLQLKRVRELPDPNQGLVFFSRRKTVNVLWSDGGESELKAQPRGGPKEGLPMYNWLGEPQPRLPQGETSLKLTGSPVFIEGRLNIVGFGE